MTKAKQKMLSGVKPTNKLTLGNYLGAIKNWVRLQAEYECIFPVVDLHSITLPHDQSILAANTWFVLASYIAAGINVDKSILFIQSHVMEHAQLSWILNCHSYMGELNRMTQYKEKSRKSGDNIPAGLFTYPILMAADILLYNINAVPVGEDQKQHVELTRNIAQRMNQRYGSDTFVVPEPVMPPVGARIMDLQDPLMKMGKSDSEASGAIYLSDSNKDMERKIKRSVTDSGSVVEYSQDKPGIRNLLVIQASITGKDPEAIAATYEGKMYGHLKTDTADIVVAELGPIRDKINELLADKGELMRIVKRGEDQARSIATETLNRVLPRIGFVVK